MTHGADPQGKVLLLGNYRSMIAATRLLGQAGYQVIVGRTPERTAHAEASRWAAETWDHPSPPDQPEAFIAALENFLARRRDVSVVLPMSDIEIATLAQHSPRLPAGVAMAMLSAEILNMCENKIELMRLASAHGIPQARYDLVSNRADLIAAAARIGFPCIVKNADSQARVFGKKAVICSNAADLDRAFATWPEGFDALIVQGYVAGRRYNVSVVARDGECLALMQSLVRRTDRADDTGQNIDSVSVPVSPEFRRQCEILTAAMNLNGIALFQFIENATDCTTHLLEVNPRMGQMFVLHAFCGLNLPVLAVKIARGQPLEPSELPDAYPTGKNCAHLEYDLKGLKHDLTAGDISLWRAAQWLLAAFWSSLRAHIHVTWQWRDPWPSLMIYGAPLYRRWLRLTGRKPRSATARSAARPADG